MKTITVKDVKSIKGKDVEAGMIMADLGVVMNVEEQEKSHGRAQSVFFFHGMSSSITYAKAEEFVQVIGQVTPEMLATYQDHAGVKVA
jgi:hypothetical protein